MKNILQILGVALLGAMVGGFIFSLVYPPKQIIIHETKPALSTVSYEEALLSGKLQREYIASTPTDFSSAADLAMPAVVYIRAIQDGGNKWGYGSKSSGSGVIISSNGYIVTNNHVVENSEEIEITLNDNRQYSAKIVGTDLSTDLALIKISEQDLPYLTFGNSDSLSIGEWVMAVGNPFGLQSTVTAGIVSAKGRDINIIDNEYRIEAFIQTDAAVNPGNSGGALINTNGELIGINTAIMTYTGRYEGYSFAVPGNLALKIIGDLKEYGSVQRGLLGVRIQDIDGRLAKELSFKNVNTLMRSLGMKDAAGVFIFGVNPNSGAESAGLKSKDIIVEVNGIKTSSIAELQEQIGRMRPGDKVIVGYLRNGKKRSAEVILKNLSENRNFARLETSDKQVLDNLGFEVRDLNESESLKFKSKGVRVTKIQDGSLVAKSNMVERYIITKVNGRPVENVDELVIELNKIEGLVELDGFYENIDQDYVYKVWKN